MHLGFTIRQKGLILTLVPFIFTMLFTALVIVRQQENGVQARRSLELRAVSSRTQSLFRKMTDAETDVIQYAYTGRSTELGSYQDARESFPTLIAGLNELARGDEYGLLLVRHIYVDATNELTYMGQIVELMKAGARGPAQKLVGAHSSGSLLAHFRSNMDALAQYQERLDADREESLARSWEGLYWLLVSGSLVDVFLMLMLSLLFSHGIRNRVEGLATNAQRLAEGQDDLVAIGGNDELASLDRDFRQMAYALRDSARRERAIIENAIDLICAIDERGCFTRVGPASQRILGFSPEALVGRPLHEIVLPEDTSRTEDMFHAVMAGRPIADFENRCLHKDGDEVSLIWSAFWSETERLVFCVAHDITERKRAEAQIWHQAYHDALTGLPNRMLFTDRLAQSISHARRHHLTAAVMFLDLDRFKLINDSLGHNAGDELLKEIGRRLKECVRQSDTVARMGGDEFTVLLPQLAHAEDAARVAEKIAAAIRRPIWLEHEEVQVTTSIGIALYPSDGEDPEALVKNADTAQYRAKMEQRDTYRFYTASMNHSAIERLKLHTNLRRALERGELSLHYQPQVSIKSGQIVGMEALVRWQSHSLGNISPAQFIPLAEETGLITAIGEWVLEEACKQNQAWQDAGFPAMKVAVNLSARQLQQSNLVETISSVLERTGMDPRFLELEITETSIMQDMKNSVEVLDAIRALGIQISIDDFGTGYSSLVYLKQLPFDSLKIDQSFVRDVTMDTQAGAIVSTVITLAQNLNRKVIAEGVETEEQLAFLRDRDCDERQGYLFSRPLPAEALTALLISSAEAGADTG